MKKTVFIVGAGASREFGLPLGSELAAAVRVRLQAEIGTVVDMNNSVIGLAQQSGIAGNCSDAAKDLCGGLITAHSIDRLLHSRRDRPLVTEMGKCGIAVELSEQEMKSPIGSVVDIRDWHTVQDALLRCNNTWLARLFSLLHEGVRPADASAIFEKCSFITFNYDRIIQRYLWLAFQQAVNIRPNEAKGLIDLIPIHHVYGSLGALPSENGSGVPFGPTIHYAQEAARSVRTFTEGADDGTLEAIRQLVSEAELIVSLGFAFDALNVDAVFERELNASQKFIGTSFGLSEIDSRRFVRKVDPEERKCRLIPSKCIDFIESDEFKAEIFM